jgi:NADH-quinone oxidoreductase subunit N
MNPSFPPEIVPLFMPAAAEIVLAAGILVLVLVGAFRGEKASAPVNMLATALLIVVAGILIMAPTETVVTFNGSFVADGFGRFMKVLVLLGSLAALLLSRDYLRRDNFDRFEYPILICIAALGMMTMIAANDLIGLYIGLELQNIALYVLATIHRDNARSSEAGLKYFVLSALSSGLLLYGASLVYGFTGTVSYPEIAQAVQGPQGLGVIFGLVFIIAGLAFKMSAVPFHMWTPDVYEGAPTPVTAFLSSAPKIAAMAMSIRILVEAFPGITREWQQIIAFISVASMLLGAFGAIGQANIKRMMAYSSIGNMGYGLVGIAAGTAEGMQGVAIYLAIYLAMTLGVFACIQGMRTENGRPELIADLAGLARTSPGRAMFFAALMFSLIGIPPLAGFFGKFYVFAAAVQAGLYWLAVIGFLTSVISAVYYLRVIKVMYFDDPRGSFVPMAIGERVVLAVTGVFVLAFWLAPSPLRAAADVAARSLFAH